MHLFGSCESGVPMANVRQKTVETCDKSAKRHVHVGKHTLCHGRPAGQTPSRAVTPCMLSVTLDELHFLLFPLLVPPTTNETRMLTYAENQLTRHPVWK